MIKIFFSIILTMSCSNLLAESHLIIDFDVIPTITGFAPASGPVGAIVTINGTNFSTTPANNIVYFGATLAKVSAATVTKLTVTVPSGATYQPLSVLVNGYIAYSSVPFNVTFSTNGAINTNSFSPEIDFTTNADAVSIHLADLDGDGKSDYINGDYGSGSGNTITVFQNKATVGMISASSLNARFSLASNTGTVSSNFADIDGDGKLDLLSLNQASQTLSVFRNISSPGTLTATSFATKIDFPTGQVPNDIAVSDFDSDGKTDIAIVNTSSSTVSIYKNISSIGLIALSSKVDFSTGSGPWSLAVADFNGDGKPDIAVSNSGSNSVSVFKNTNTPLIINSGSFASKIDYAVGVSPRFITTGDIDGDSKSDIASANNSSATVSVLRNTIAASVIDAAAFAAKVDFSAGPGPWGLALGDIDGDTKLELAITNNSNATVSVLKNVSIAGTINTSSFANRISFSTGLGPVSVVFGDIDGDGKTDMATIGSTTLSVFKNNLSTVSTSKPDSLSLIALYNNVAGGNWTSKNNWTTTTVDKWYGITVSNGRVTKINLSNNNLIGVMPGEFVNLTALISADLSSNKISYIPDLSSISSLTSLNLSGNNLDFASLETNKNIAGVNYSSQADLGTALDTLVAVGKPARLKLKTGGTKNAYQWKRNGTAVAGATTSTYDIAAIGRSNMGDYVVEITNASVPGLILKSTVQRATAVANVSGKLQVSATTPVTSGKMLLLKINPVGQGYDTTRIQAVKTDGTYTLDKVVLDDYVLVGLGDVVQYKEYFPTYYDGSVLWENATKIILNEDRINVNVTLKTLPATKPAGDGELFGTFTVGDLLKTGRTMNARVEGAGASVRRGTKSGRPAGTLDGEDIIAYVYTNARGEFDFTDIDEGSYILNIQYPGVPMDTESDIYITLGPKAKRQNVQKVDALAEAGKITVKRLIIVGMEDEVNELVKIYPNPAAEELFIEMPSIDKGTEAVLTDMTGREHRRVSLGDEARVMNVRDISTGIYVLTIYNEDKQITRAKIVIR